MHVIHISAECYPVAKAGGLGDVVGSLPLHQTKSGISSWVVMPAYDTPWIRSHKFEDVHSGFAHLGGNWFQYHIKKEIKRSLGFPLYIVDIPGRFDRPGIYFDPGSGYTFWDEFERYASFQVCVLDWIKSFAMPPDLIHCHDHHTAFIPFLLTACPEYESLIHVPTVLTIHNGEYHGVYEYNKRFLLPYFNPEKAGLLEWDGNINALACGIRTSWALTTVSPTYLKELSVESRGLEGLFRHELPKSRGILNGIDTDVWNPETDPMIHKNFGLKNLNAGKEANKKALCKQFNLKPERPTFSFIGRLVREKGADLLPDLISSFLAKDLDANFIVLGTGDPILHDRFSRMNQIHLGHFDSSLQYNEKLSHLIYAGSDFLLMPSRVEPCGLNQMFALRYGTIPIVRDIGGLHDTIIDYKNDNGYGIKFENFTMDEALDSLLRAYDLFFKGDELQDLRKKAMALDFSWEKSASEYINLYNQLINN